MRRANNGRVIFMHDIRAIINDVYTVVENHRISEGKYRRWIRQNDEGTRNLGVNEYGCADASNILYMIGRFPSTLESRLAHYTAMQELQSSESGMFVEATHHTIHTTAHVIAALELYDQKALYPIKDLEYLKDKEALYKFLDELPWDDDPWSASHRGAGLYAAMVLNGQADTDWQKLYFDWLYENADPETGFWRKGCVLSGGKPVFHHLAGTFHYLFNHEYEHMPLRYPEKVIDTCIALLERYVTHTNEASMKIDSNDNWRFGDKISFAEIDWVYCLTRAMRQSPHRFEEGKNALYAFADDYIGWLSSIDRIGSDDFNDLHALFGCVCCLAELQSALPGYIKTEKPLKLVLDRRPFI